MPLRQCSEKSRGKRKGKNIKRVESCEEMGKVWIKSQKTQIPRKILLAYRWSQTPEWYYRCADVKQQKEGALTLSLKCITHLQINKTVAHSMLWYCNVYTEKLPPGGNAELQRNKVTGKVVLNYLNYLNTILNYWPKCLLPHVSILVGNYYLPGRELIKVIYLYSHLLVLCGHIIVVLMVLTSVVFLHFFWNFSRVLQQYLLLFVFFKKNLTHPSYIPNLE